MRISSDDRRIGFFDLFDLPLGDLNIIRLHPGAICAWHRHQRQEDWLFCVQGTIRVGRTECTPGEMAVTLKDNPEQFVQWDTLDEHNPRTLCVPIGTWHGYQNIGAGDAVIVLYATNKYDGSDEERRSLQAMGISWDRQPR